MDVDQLKEIARKYLDGKATKDEEQRLHEYYNIINKGETETVITENHITSAEFGREMLAELKRKMSNNETVHLLKPRRFWLRIAIAASILIAISTIAYFVIPRKEASQTIPIAGAGDVKAPDKTKASITLADGRIISLDDLTTLSQDNVTIVKNENGEIAYTGNTTEVVFNTLYNPRGSKVVSLALNDGTKVWLNAESSLKYPIAFAGTTRNVEITGEAYFEVTKDPSRKFIVNANNKGEIEVIGTHFNVMAYENEDALKTTLLEGAVRFKSKGNTVLLKPGQQSQLDHSGQIELVKNADTELATAWKNGLTAFKSADLKTVMRQVQRWYDVDVTYEGALPQRSFTGEIPRNVNLSELLKLFEVNNIRFSIDANNKKLTVKP